MDLAIQDINKMKTEEEYLKLMGKTSLIWVLVSFKIEESVLEKLIEKSSESQFCWGAISEHQVLSEEFIEKYQDRVNWNRISYYQKLSNEFVDKFHYRLDFNVFGNYPYRKKCYWCDDMLKVIKFKNISLNYCPICLR